MNFPAGATRQFKIDACDPEVYRYRWPTVDFARSSTFRATAACHELEIYPDDRITCAAIDATLLLDFSGAFDDNGTPTDYSTTSRAARRCPCARRASSTAAEPLADERVRRGLRGRRGRPEPARGRLAPAAAAALARGRREARRDPSHGLRGPAAAERESAVPRPREDIFVVARGGADPVRPLHPRDGRARRRHPADRRELLPGRRQPARERRHPRLPGRASSAPRRRSRPARRPTRSRPTRRRSTRRLGGRARDLPRRRSRRSRRGRSALRTSSSRSRARTASSWRWYSQGTQVVDFTENADGTIDFKRAGYFVPENANEWVSHVFKVQQNPDGSFTYWGATGDFALGDAGRNAIDIYKVTLPAPPKPRTESGEPLPGTPTFPGRPRGRPGARVRDRARVSTFIRAKPRAQAQARALLVRTPPRPRARPRCSGRRPAAASRAGR